MRWCEGYLPQIKLWKQQLLVTKGICIIHLCKVTCLKVFAFSGSINKVSLQDLYLCSPFSWKKKIEVVIKNWEQILSIRMGCDTENEVTVSVTGRKTSSPTSFNLEFVCGEMASAKPRWLFLFLTPGICSRHYSYIRHKCLRD